MLGNRLVSQSNKKQTPVDCSTAEAKYVSTGRCCVQILCIHNHLLDYDLNLSKTSICCDNTSAIQMIQNPLQHSRTKHIRIHRYFIRDIVQKGKVELFYIPSTDQLTDIFTKALDEKTLRKLIADLGMILMI